MVQAKPVVDVNGFSRKSVVDPGVAARGGGHLCPHELYVYIDEMAKKSRITSGLTVDGGKLHVYVREFPEKLSSKVVRHIFENAADMLEDLAGAPPAPPPPPPRRLTAAVPPPPAEDFLGRRGWFPPMFVKPDNTEWF